MTLPTNTARAFNEWMRRFIDEPDRFKTESQEITDFTKSKLNDKEPDYGTSCTAYLQKILDEMDRPVAVEELEPADAIR